MPAYLMGLQHFDKRSVFDEADGKIGVFCRTNIGHQIFSEAIKAGSIVSSDYCNYADDCSISQNANTPDVL